MNTARYFLRREDYEPPKTPLESPFRQFNVSCLKCSSFQVKIIGVYDEDTGETSLALVCGKCGERERLIVVKKGEGRSSSRYRKI